MSFAVTAADEGAIEAAVATAMAPAPRRAVPADDRLRVRLMLKMAHGDLQMVETAPDEAVRDLDELCRPAARDTIAVALEAESLAYLEIHAEFIRDDGRRRVVGSGYARPQQLTTGAGAVEVRAQRVRDRREGEPFSSTLLPPYMRRSPKVADPLPSLYLRGAARAQPRRARRRARTRPAGAGRWVDPAASATACGACGQPQRPARPGRARGCASARCPRRGDARQLRRRAPASPWLVVAVDSSRSISLANSAATSMGEIR